MTIAELFINIGVKGSDKAQQAVGGVVKGLNSIQETGLAAKAALLGIIYGLERLTGAAGQRGMELKQFADYTGLSTDKLQQWQYAMMMSGVEAKDTAEGIKALQANLLKMDIGEGPIKGMQQLTNVLKGNIDTTKLTDAFYMMDKLREYAKTEKNSALANETLSSFGLSPAVIQAMRAGSMDPNKVPFSKIRSPEEIAALQKVNTAWLDFQNTLTLFGDRLVSAFGGEAVATLNRALSTLLKLSKVLKEMTGFSKVLTGVAGALTAIGIAVAVIGGPLTALSAALTLIIYLLSEWDKHSKGKDSVFGGKDFKNNILEKAFKSMMEPSVKPGDKTSSTNSGNTNTANINIYNTGQENAEDVAAAVKKEVVGAFFTSQWQTVT